MQIAMLFDKNSPRGSFVLRRDDKEEQSAMH